MRSLSILFLGLLLSFLSVQLGASKDCGTNWLGNDAVGNDPDFSVSAHELGSLVTPSPDLAVPIKTPTSKPRVAPDERGPIQPVSSGPNMSMPDPSPKSLVNTNNNSNQTLNQTENQNPNQPQTEAKPVDLSGKWSVKFNDSAGKSLDLILLSAGSDRTMGYRNSCRKWHKDTCDRQRNGSRSDCHIDHKNSSGKVRQPDRQGIRPRPLYCKQCPIWNLCTEVRWEVLG